MKNNIMLIAAACLLVGCGCSSTIEVPAQPGWKIITNTEQEANELRELTGNDTRNTNRVVVVTAPTFIRGTR